MSATKVAIALLFLASAASAQDYNVQGRPRTSGGTFPWAAVGSIGTGTNTGTGTTLTVTTSATLEAGNVAVCSIAKNESGAGTTDGNGNAQYTSVTDTAGNTWVEAFEWCNMQTSTTQDGACVAVYYTEAGSELASGGTITATHTSVAARAITCNEFTTSGTVSEAAGENGLANDAADPGSMTIATGSVREHLFIRATACETNTTTYTADADYTAFTNATANGGSQASSMGARGEYRIATETTSAASDPTLGARDCASAMIALDAN